MNISTKSFGYLRSYLADITTEDTRTFRLSIYSGIVMSSVPFANYVSVYILDFGGDWAVWITSLALVVSALFYLVFFVAESRCQQQSQDCANEEPDTKGSVTKLRLLTFADDCLPHIKTMMSCFSVAFKPRAGNNRVRFVLLLIMSCLMPFSMGKYTLLTKNKRHI